MGRAFKMGMAVGMAAVAGKMLWDRPWQTTVPPSERLDAWVPGAQFCDTIVLPGVRADADQVFEALSQVMPSSCKKPPTRLTSAPATPLISVTRSLSPAKKG